MSVRRHLTGPNALATVALFVALGGTSYAAVRLPKDSVGATQLRKNAVTSTKVKDRSLRRRDVSSAEVAALHGATGSIGATGARGPRGDQGDTSPFPAPGTLRSGEVVRGAFAAGEIVPFDQELTDAINLPVQAPVALDPVHVDVAGGVDDPGGVCTGSYRPHGGGRVRVYLPIGSDEREEPPGDRARRDVDPAGIRGPVLRGGDGPRRTGRLLGLHRAMTFTI